MNFQSRRARIALSATCLLAMAGTAAAQSDPAPVPAADAPQPVAAPAPVPTGPCSKPPAGASANVRCVPALTPVVISLDAPVSSRTAKTGENFAFSLAEPIMLDGVVLVPAGTKGVGEVVHAKGSGMGVGGELVLAARYLDYDGRQIRLRSMKFGVVGKDQQTLAFAVAVTAGLPGLLIKGKHIDIAQGTLAGAKLTEDLYLEPPAPAPTAPEPAAGDVPAASPPPLQPGSAQ